MQNGQNVQFDGILSQVEKTYTSRWEKQWQSTSQWSSQTRWWASETSAQPLPPSRAQQQEWSSGSVLTWRCIRFHSHFDRYPPWRPTANKRVQCRAGCGSLSHHVGASSCNSNSHSLKTCWAKNLSTMTTIAIIIWFAYLDPTSAIAVRTNPIIESIAPT